MSNKIDYMLAARETDGDKCGKNCPWNGFIRCDAFKQVRQWDNTNTTAYRCNDCLLTPSANALTPEMIQAVREAANMLNAAMLPTAATNLCNAFNIKN